MQEEVKEEISQSVDIENQVSDNIIEDTEREDLEINQIELKPKDVLN